jgi:hypothetical protein
VGRLVWSGNMEDASIGKESLEQVTEIVKSKIYSKNCAKKILTEAHMQSVCQKRSGTGFECQCMAHSVYNWEAGKFMHGVMK